MARSLIHWSQAGTSSSTFLGTSISSLSSLKCKFSITFPHRQLPRLFRFLFKCTIQEAIDISQYKEAFSKRMAMAGLKPHHRIALGVSGGPDSMALCVLMAGWKTDSLLATGDSGRYVDGLLALIVDHGLRSESKDEATVVSNRVTQMGIRCEIASCDWLAGRPKQGHLQEAARDMRYQIFQEICIQHQIGVLLIAHHADDQAELFILRLSRNSGVLGLAGMPFTSQIFSTHTHFYADSRKNYGILLVRPLLDFFKDDMYKICRAGNQDWVEDPTNQSPLFARNRIRMSLGVSGILNSELHAVIYGCRKVRMYVDQICENLMDKAVTIMDLGYAIIDLEIFNKSKIEDICLSKFSALVLQFISQRQKPVRGNSSKLVIDYLRTYPCKTSLTVAGCYLCPSPGSKGTKALVCCSVDCPLPSAVELFHAPSYREQKHSVPHELEQIVKDGKSYSNHFTPNAADVHFLDVTPESILIEAKRLNILSESTYESILLLQTEEIKRFKSETQITFDSESKHESGSISSSGLLKHGQVCNFMNRFFVTWKIRVKTDEGCLSPCESCMLSYDMALEVRHMIESDWLYLAKLAKCPSVENIQEERVCLPSGQEDMMEKTDVCVHHAWLSAQRALRLLKSIPVAARRGLPVLVGHQGQLLSIPSISFNHCPCLMASATLKPRVPLGGGHSSFI